MYAAGFGIFRQNEYVAICLFLSLIVAFHVSIKSNIPEKFQVLTKILDLALLIVGVLSLYSFVKVQNDMETGFYSLSTFDITFGVLGILVLLEWKRIWGLPLLLLPQFVLFICLDPTCHQFYIQVLVFMN